MPDLPRTPRSQDDWKDFLKNGKLTPAGLDFLASRGYTGSLEWTYQEAMEFASLGTDNWEWVCQFTLMWERNACLAYSPFSPKIDGVALLKELSGLADAQRCKEYIFDDGESLSSCIWTAVNIVDYALMFAGGAGVFVHAAVNGVRGIGRGSHVLAASDEIAQFADDVVRTDNLLGPEDLASAAAGCSFGRGTRVLQSDGTTTPIADIGPGDDVLATDPVAGVTVASTVTRSPGPRRHAARPQRGRGKAYDHGGPSVLERYGRGVAGRAGSSIVVSVS